MRHLYYFFVFGLLIFISCTPSQKETEQADNSPKLFTTPLGLVKAYAEPSEKMLEQYNEALANYEKNPDDPENLIWLGRRTAYMAKYDEAIELYTEGITRYPENPKFYRHRGHRYISIREYDKAINDLEKAAELINGTENEIEPDGMPNARNIPVSSLHGNIYYHLGLAYYLKHDYAKAYDAYVNCRNSANNPDNIVSSTHWLFMISHRLGNEEQAKQSLEPIVEGLDIIENHDYYKLCLFYKGLLAEDSITPKDDSPSSDALKYGLANWKFYTHDKEEAEIHFRNMMEGNAWTSFGYLAAESDLLEYYTK